MEKVTFTELRGRISWGSIIAGVMTVLAISILLSILGTSIGLFMFDPTADNPTSGIGTTVGIWTVVSVLLSLIAGGFVAGKLSASDGVIHGFLVWATTMIVTIILGAFLAMGAVRMTSNMLGSISSVTGSALSGIGSVALDGVSGLSQQAQNLFGDINLDDNVDDGDVQKDVLEALRKSGVKEFQPEYLQNELKSVKNDFTKSVKQIATNPNNAEAIINNFTSNLKSRVDKFSANIDRDDLTKAIANNSNMSKAEVDKAVDQYMDIINKAKEQANLQISNLEKSIDQAKADWEVMKKQALEEADKASNAAGRSGVMSFFAMLIGAAICGAAGLYGAKKTRQGFEA